ncbi:MAG: hypothetical protein ABFS18_12020 [Thermodesulfobacteriota bacterium]
MLTKKGKFTLVPQLDRYPWLVEFAQTIVGRLVVLAIFSGLIFFFWPLWGHYIGLCLFFCIFLPQYRHVILVVASLGAVFLGRTYMEWNFINDLGYTYGISRPLIDSPFTTISIVGFVLLCFFLIFHFSKSSRSGFRIRRPILTIIAGYLLLAFGIPHLPVHDYVKLGLWIFLIVFSKYFWFLCYSLLDRNDPKVPPFPQHLGLYYPFWYVSVLPYYRGISHFQRIIAKSPEELAICRLKGLKLLIWACYLSMASLLIGTVFYGKGQDISGIIKFLLEANGGPLNIYFQNKLIYVIDKWPLLLNLPHYKYAFAQSVSGTPLAFYWNWLALIVWFIGQLLILATISHAGIAICRMAGYNALRNVYNPLKSKSIADFWNRMYFYYKELLVNVFYYPTFLNLFKNRPILRYYAATMAAACVGNFFYHYLLKVNMIVRQGAFETMISMHSLMFYCFLLGNGIFLSQYRKLKTGRSGRKLPQPFRAIIVLGFYCLIGIFWDDNVPLIDNLKFFLALFNITIGGNG